MNTNFNRLDIWDTFWKNRKPENEMLQNKANVSMLYAANKFNSYNCTHVEDWGCGNCVFKLFLQKINPNMLCKSIDGSLTPYCDKKADLTNCLSNADGIHIRHVFEHNIEYKKILKNALKSFNKVLIITFFDNLYGDHETKIRDIFKNWNNKNVDMINLQINKVDINKIILENNCKIIESKYFNEEKQTTITIVKL